MQRVSDCCNRTLDPMLIAHASHWLVNLAYLAPVVGFLAWLGIVTYRERRAGPDDDRGPREESGGLS